MHITAAQMAMFQVRADETFLNGLARDMRVRASEPLRDLDDAGLARMVRAGVARARAYGLTWESTLAGFVYVMGDVSPGWDGQPELHAELLRRRPAADAMFNGLFDESFDVAWDAAAGMSGSVGWFLPAPLPWPRQRERVAAALPAALASLGVVDPGTALALSDAGQAMSVVAGLDSEDGAFVAAVGVAVTGEVKLGTAARFIGSRTYLGNAARMGALRSWVRHNTRLWV